jgi:hypothetical protein
MEATTDATTMEAMEAMDAMEAMEATTKCTTPTFSIFRCKPLSCRNATTRWTV